MIEPVLLDSTGDQTVSTREYAVTYIQFSVTFGSRRQASNPIGCEIFCLIFLLTN
jgi:hypothetical protein